MNSRYGQLDILFNNAGVWLEGPAAITKALKA